MPQFLRVFKKDVRGHWPEILISLALLALYARVELHPQVLSPYDENTFFFLIADRFVRFFLILSWMFLILRVGQSETLVGDRQWWVTKPYIWWQLLLSKLFFVVVFISVPLFLVQLLLLHHGGFALLPNLIGLFLMQLTVPLVVIVCTLALASLTRNLPQALLGIGITVIVFFVGGPLLNSLSSHTMGDSSPLMDGLESLLVRGSLVLVPVWQFARRRTWASRITLAACIGGAAVLSLIPFGSRTEQSYPLLAAGDSPAQFTIPSIPESHNNSSNSPRFSRDPVLSIPMNVSGIAPNSVVRIDGMKITVDSLDGSHWTRGWVGQYGELWPGSQRQALNYQVKLKEYERVKATPLNLHIQLALSEYKQADERILVIPATIFRDSVLGICGLVPGDVQFLQCRKPFYRMSYIARFDAPNSPCVSVQRSPEAPPTNVDVAYAWAAPTEKMFPEPGLNPIVEYQLGLNPPRRVPDATSTVQSRYSVTSLCPGAEIRLGRPTLGRQFRIQLELPNVRLEDLVVRTTLGTSGGTTIDLRGM